MPASRLKPSICIDSITSNKNINRNTACSELFESGDLEFACENCKAEVDVLSHSRKKRKRNDKLNWSRKFE